MMPLVILTGFPASPKAKILTDTSFCFLRNEQSGFPVSSSVSISLPLRKALDQSKAFGFLGPGPVEVAIDHAAGFLDVAATALGSESAGQGFWVDLGSGGGVPGLVGIDRLPDSRWWLVDAQAKRIRFLESVIAEWDATDRVEVVLGRAEEVCRARVADIGDGADIVVARGFGPPALTAECAVGFLRLGGLLIVSEPPDSNGERWAGLQGSALGLEFAGVQRSGQFGYAVFHQARPAERGYPRTGSALVKKPVF
jgi:16S rRNA (guanine527-N7)-methyltransferase